MNKELFNSVKTYYSNLFLNSDDVSYKIDISKTEETNTTLYSSPKIDIENNKYIIFEIDKCYFIHKIFTRYKLNVRFYEKRRSILQWELDSIELYYSGYFNHKNNSFYDKIIKIIEYTNKENDKDKFINLYGMDYQSINRKLKINKIKNKIEQNERKVN